MSSTHRGEDFPVNEGAPVVVSNSGTVVLAKELFYEGNTKCDGPSCYRVNPGKADMEGERGSDGTRRAARIWGSVNGAYLDP